MTSKAQLLNISSAYAWLNTLKPLSNCLTDKRVLSLLPFAKDIFPVLLSHDVFSVCFISDSDHFATAAPRDWRVCQLPPFECSLMNSTPLLTLPSTFCVSPAIRALIAGQWMCLIETDSSLIRLEQKKKSAARRHGVETHWKKNVLLERSQRSQTLLCTRWFQRTLLQILM